MSLHAWPTRRQAMAAFASFVAGSPLVRAQQLRGEEPGRIAPLEDLVNVFEIEPMAQRKLDSVTFAEIAGSDRRAFDRITFRPRVMVNTSALDTSVELFEERLAAPILIGPASQQGRFHPDGELGMARGAAEAKTALVVAARSSRPLESIAAEAKTPLWFQVEPEADMGAVRARVDAAVTSGCKAVCLTVGTREQPADWALIDKLRQGLAVPFVLKGIMTPEEARAAVQRGVQGIVVSNYRGAPDPALASSIEVLPAIAEAVSGKAAILIDGSFRRGGDVLKAIALGATAALVVRPVLWGLAAYGSAGVRYALDLMQGELVRAMTMCGKPNLQAVDRTAVKIHSR